MDYIIMVPNGLGAILGFIQMFLRLVVPSGDTSPSKIETQVDDEDKSIGIADADIEATTASASTTEAPAKEETENE